MPQNREGGLNAAGCSERERRRWGPSTGTSGYRGGGGGSGFVQYGFDCIRALPGVRGVVASRQEKVMESIRSSIGEPPADLMVGLPEAGIPPAAVLAKLKDRERGDIRISDGCSTVSGTVYIRGAEHRALLNTVYCRFSHTNPLHTSVFPSVRLLEAEVVSMVAGLLGGGPNGVSTVCGAMTAGGSESIISAVKASRDYMREVRGVRHPEMIIADSAHAAYFKAAEWLSVRLIVVPVGKDYALSAATVRRRLSSNTVLVVASSPGFPHGVMDPIADIAAATAAHGVPLHVDACLGGFVLPFAERLGYAVPPFDFRLAGVTSISVDTHKYGMSHKGTSVVLYRHRDLRRHQYTRVTEWSGGLYISPGLPGSRNGALIATAWASLVAKGMDGFLALTDEIMKAATRFMQGVAQIPGLELCGQPVAMVVAFKSSTKKLDIFKLSDLMQRRGWHLNALIRPPALHVCITAQHVDIINQLLQDLQASTLTLLNDPNCVCGGMAPVYGMGASMPDRAAVGEFLELFQDAVLST